MAAGDTLDDAVIAGSAGGELGDAVQASTRRKHQRHSKFEPAYPIGMCSNCGTTLIGPSCHNCGQTADTFHRPIWDLLMDVLDGLFGFEGRLWRTLPPLMLQPGKLTRQYLSGARARYVMPFRLYLTASVLFFLTVFAINSFQPDPGAAGLPASARDATDSAIEQVRSGELDQQLEEAGISEAQRAAIAEQITRGIDIYEQPVDPDETPEERAARLSAGPVELKRAIRAALLPELGLVSEGGPAPATPAVTADGANEMPIELRERLADQADRIIDDGGAAVTASMQTWAPRLMFGLLPIYALLLAITHFYKRGYFFYDHLVVSLHFHAVLFFGLILVFALGAFVGLAPVLFGFMLWSNYYLYRIHRVVYAHGRFSSLLRTLFMDFVYGVILSLGMLVLLAIGILSV